MTVTSLPTRRLRTPGDLVDALGIRFSDEQLAAVTADLEPAVVIAGAGSGKTTVMAARVVWLVGSGLVRPREVLGLTFTRKAAAELAQRVRAALVRAGVLSAEGVDDDGEQVVMTYDAFAARLVSEHGLWLGYEGDPRMVTGAARFRLASRVVTTAAGPFDHLVRLRPGTVTERVLDLDSQLQAHLVNPDELDAHARRYLVELERAPLNRLRNVYRSVREAGPVAMERLELASLVRTYQELKRRTGHVEFADQMAAAARLAAEVPAVSESLRQQFPVVLLDEYQDTSSAQAVLLRELFSGPDSASGLGHPVTAVGDPFQAIYGWRGAAASNILQFPAHFPRADGTPAARLSLTVNRRSGPAILAAANRLAEPLRTDPTLSYDLSDAVLRAPEGTPDGDVYAGTFRTWPDEVTWMADLIAETGKPGSWSEIACLLRRNGDIGPVYSALVARDVPVEIVGLGGLLSVPEIADLVATLRIVDDVTDNPSLIRLLTGPRWRIGRGDIEVLGRRSREIAQGRLSALDFPDDALTAALDEVVADVDPSELVSLVESLADLGDGPYSPEARRRFMLLAGELDYLRRHAAEPVLDFVRRVIATIGLDTEVSVASGTDAPLAQVGGFLDAVAAYVDVDSDASLSGLLAYLKDEEQHGGGLDQVVPSAGDSVKLLTIHKAKGLEWNTVFLPALVDDVFPSNRVTGNWVTAAAALPAPLRGDRATVPQLASATDQGFKRYEEELREDARRSEDRLAYVAATRARKALVATGHTWRAAEIRPRRTSPYLDVLLTAASARGTIVNLAGPPGVSNPLDGASAAVDWPGVLDPDAWARRRESAAAVESLRGSAMRSGPALAGAPAEVAELVSSWDLAIDGLLREARADGSDTVGVPMPVSLTATDLLRANRDPSAFAAQLARPMPVGPSRAGRFGSRFHEWVVRHFNEPALLDPEEFDVRDDDAEDEAALQSLCRAFAAGRFGERPPDALEFPFVLMLGAHQVRGRIDAVYAASSGVVPGGLDALVVDWKTGSSQPDPLQLAIYRVAWAKLRGLPVDRVGAAFHHVVDDHLEIVADLPDAAELERILGRVTDL